MKCTTNFTSMGDLLPYRNVDKVVCPVCGELFEPAPEHSYLIGKNRNRLVCTYTCMRKWEKGEAVKPKKVQKKPLSKRNYNAREGVAVRIVETGEVFHSAYACGRHLGTCGANVRYALKTGNGYKGYHFEKVKEGDTE